MEKSGKTTTQETQIQDSGQGFDFTTKRTKLTYWERVERAMRKIKEREAENKGTIDLEKEWEKFNEDVITFCTIEACQKGDFYVEQEGIIRTTISGIGEILRNTTPEQFENTLVIEINKKIGPHSTLKTAALAMGKITELAIATFNTEMPPEIPTEKIRAKVQEIMSQL